jgi:uncharacterized protein (DUF305 family)
MKLSASIAALAAAVWLIGCGQPADKAEAPVAADTHAQSGGTDASAKMHEIMSRPMQSMDMSGNVDKDFATMMAEHHQQGVDMAQMELDSGQNPQLKAIAQSIVDTQTEEKKKLLEIAGTLPDTPTDKAASDEMHMAMMEPMPEMQASGDVDKDFATMMAAHHDMAIKMVDVELKSGKNAELKAMAQKMKEDQTKEKAELLKLAGSS